MTARRPGDRWSVAGAALLVLAATGCAAGGAVAPPVETGPTQPYHLRVAPPRIDYEPTAASSGGQAGVSVLADPSVLQGALRRALDARALFERIEPLPSLAEGELPLDRAAQVGADLVLETRVRRQVVSYRGTNDLYIPNIFVWGFLWIPSWWIADETYAMELEVEVVLRSVRSGRTVYEGVHRLEHEQDLDDFERGWMLWGIFRAPDALGPDNWRRIDRAMAPGASEALAADVAEALREEIADASETAEFRRAMARRHALVIGISRFADPRIQALSYADADAAEFHQHLVEGSGLPAHGVRLLRNGRATADAVRAEIDRLAAIGGDDGDEVIVYFAGYGGREGDRVYLLPHDADPEDLAGTAIPIDEIVAGRRDGREADGRGRPQVTLILDAPFTNRFLGRGTPGDGTGEWSETLAGLLDGRGCQVLTGARPGEGCLELEDVGQGIFTYYLLQALEGRGDRNRDGTVTWQEACEFAGRMVEDHAGFEGRTQRPQFHSGIDTTNDEGGEAGDT